MSFFRKLKKVGKSAIGGLGDIAKYAAPVLAATGVGIPAAALLGGVGGLAGTLNDKEGFSLSKGLREGAISAGGAVAGGTLRGALKGGGAMSKVLPGLTSKGGALGKAGSAAKALGGSRLGRTLLDNPELAIAGVAGIQNARANSKRNGYVDEQLARARASDAELAPMRALAFRKMAQMENAAPALPRDTGNPYGG